MSTLVNLSDPAANAAATALGALCNGGTIQIYSGPQPVNANTPVSGSNALLVTLTFGSPAWGIPVGGLLTATPITSGTAIALGTATFARCISSNGTTVVMDYTVGISASGINLNTINIIAGAAVSITSLTCTIPET